MRFSEKGPQDDQVVVSAAVEVRHYTLQHLFRQFSALHFINKKASLFLLWAINGMKMCFKDIHIWIVPSEAESLIVWNISPLCHCDKPLWVSSSKCIEKLKCAWHRALMFLSTRWCCRHKNVSCLRAVTSKAITCRKYFGLSENKDIMASKLSFITRLVISVGVFKPQSYCVFLILSLFKGLFFFSFIMVRFKMREIPLYCIWSYSTTTDWAVPD